MKLKIDLNCDLGEWTYPGVPEKDKSIMPFISSCNIACGGHAGDRVSIKETVLAALDQGVAIGAHPSYPDRANFGRLAMNISEEELRRSILSQLSEFMAILEANGGKLHHIKPHGALYNVAMKDATTARILVQAVLEVAPDVALYLPPQSVSKAVAEQAGIRVISEVFADRAYHHDLTLRPRSLPGAVLTNEVDVLNQLREMIFRGRVRSFSGDMIHIEAETVCLHSDTPGAVELARKIHRFLKENDVEIHAH